MFIGSCWLGVAGGVGGPLDPPGWLEHSLEQSSLGDDVSLPPGALSRTPCSWGLLLPLDWLVPLRGLRRRGWYL